MAKTNTKKAAPKRPPRNTKKQLEQAFEQFDKLQKSAEAGDNVVAGLTKTQEKLEKRLGGKAYFIKPNEPLPSELLDLAKKELFASQLTASEAIFGFIGWLTTRNMRIVCSKQDTVGAISRLASSFVKEQQLPELREDWNMRLQPMEKVDEEITNDPAMAQNFCSPSFDEAYKQVLSLFRGFHTQRQNHLLARLLEELKESRLTEFHVLSGKIEQQTERHHQLADAAKELDQVLSGNFTIVHV